MSNGNNYFSMQAKLADRLIYLTITPGQLPAGELERAIAEKVEKIRGATIGFQKPPPEHLVSNPRDRDATNLMFPDAFASVTISKRPVGARTFDLIEMAAEAVRRSGEMDRTDPTTPDHVAEKVAIAVQIAVTGKHPDEKDYFREIPLPGSTHGGK